MKNSLLALGLPEPVVDGIIECFHNYTMIVEEYDKPKGKMAFNDNLDEIEKLSNTLAKKLSKLSNFEKQQLRRVGGPKVFDLSSGLMQLVGACRATKNLPIKWSRKEPFILDLTVSLWRLLEGNDINVTVYKDGILCRILNVLFPKPDSEEWAFNMIRKAKNQM